MSLRYALIGCGRIAPNHITAARDNGLNIVAVCDLDHQKLDQTLQRFGLEGTAKPYQGYQEMLANEELDLIAIATDSGSHAEVSLACIEAGVNLIIEKPIALSIKDADLIINKAREKGVKVSACHQNRYNKAIQKIRKALDEERFGRLFHGAAHIRWSRDLSYYQQDSWRGTWENDGGALMNQCIHNIDLLRWMMGDEITEVMAMTDRLNHDYIEAEDLGLGIIKFANGSYGLIEGTTNVFPKSLEETLYIFGEAGTVKAGGQSVNILEEWSFLDKVDDPAEVKEGWSEDPRNVYGFGHTRLYENVVEAILSDTEPYVTAEDGKRAVELVLALYQSSATGKAVKFPLEDCSTLDFKDLFKL